MKLVFDKLVHSTDFAFLFQFGDDKAWVPMSVAEIVTEDQRGPEYGGEVEVKDWFAENEGLEVYEI